MLYNACLLYTSDGISDIVHIACDPGKLDVMFRITEFFQNVRSGFCYPDTMGLRVVGVAQQAQIPIAFFQQFVDFFVVLDLSLIHIYRKPLTRLCHSSYVPENHPGNNLYLIHI